MVKNRKEITNLEGVKRPANDQYVCFAMVLLLANRFQTKLDSYLGEITLKQWLLLCMLNHIEAQEVSLNELAAVVGCSRQNVKKMVAILVGKEYLQLEVSRTDKRAYQVSLTEKAGAFFKAFGNQGDELLKRLFEGSTEEELAVMAKVMGKISINLEVL